MTPPLEPSRFMARAMAAEGLHWRQEQEMVSLNALSLPFPAICHVSLKKATSEMPRRAASAHVPTVNVPTVFYFRL